MWNTFVSQCLCSEIKNKKYSPMEEDCLEVLEKNRDWMTLESIVEKLNEFRNAKMYSVRTRLRHLHVLGDISRKIIKTKGSPVMYRIK